MPWGFTERGRGNYAPKREANTKTKTNTRTKANPKAKTINIPGLGPMQVSANYKPNTPNPEAKTINIPGLGPVLVAPNHMPNTTNTKTITETRTKANPKTITRTRTKANPKTITNTKTKEVLNSPAYNPNEVYRPDTSSADFQAIRRLSETGTATVPSNNVRQEVLNSPADNSNELINRSADDYRRQVLAGIQQGVNQQVSNYEGRLSNLGNEYYNKRNKADTAHIQNASRLKEIMANSGLTGSGENLTATTNLMGARQQALTGLGQQEQGERDSLNRAIADTRNAGSLQEVQAIAEAEKMRNQALLGQYNTDRSFGLQQDRFGLDQQRFDYDMQQNEINDLVRQNYGDYQSAINNLVSQGVSPNDPRLSALQSARTQKIQEQEQLARERMEFETRLNALNLSNAQKQKELEWFDRNRQADINYKNAMISNITTPKGSTGGTEDYYTTAVKNLQNRFGYNNWTQLDDRRRDSLIAEERLRLGDPQALGTARLFEGVVDGVRSLAGNIGDRFNEKSKELDERELFRQRLGY